LYIPYEYEGNARKCILQEKPEKVIKHWRGIERIWMSKRTYSLASWWFIKI